MCKKFVNGGLQMWRLVVLRVEITYVNIWCKRGSGVHLLEEGILTLMVSCQYTGYSN